MSHLTPASIWLCLGIYALYSLADSIGRILMLNGMSVPQFIGSLLVIALVPLFIMAVREKALKRIIPRKPGIVAVALLIYCVEIGGAFYALAHIEQLVECYALFFTLPLWTVLLSEIFLKEKLTRTQHIAMLIGFMGVLVANWPTHGLGQFGLGHAAALASPLAGALRIIILRRFSQRDGGYSLIIPLFAGVSILSLTLASGNLMPLNGSMLTLLLIAGIGQGVAACCFLQAARRVPAPMLAPFQYSQIFWALVLGIVIFREWPEPNVYAGLALIVAGGYLLMRKPSPAK